MYVKLNLLEEAHTLFDKIPDRNINNMYTFSSILRGYVILKLGLEYDVFVTCIHHILI